eukprot:SM000011S19167  [mRNA]  locus=s11:1344555:1345410:+ [translate_table: standard]
MFSGAGAVWQLRAPPGCVRRPRRAGLLCLRQLPPTSASSPSWRGPTPRRNGEERAETVLSSAEPLPLPMPYPDSRPLPKEAIDKILQCDPEVEVTAGPSVLRASLSPTTPPSLAVCWQSMRHQLGEDFEIHMRYTILIFTSIRYVQKYTVREDVEAMSDNEESTL